MQLIKQLTFIATLTLPFAALAHGGGDHLMGTVKAIDEKGLTVETKDKEVKVAFDEKTTFEKDGAASSAKELGAGARVVVHTTNKQRSPDPVAVLVKFGGSRPDQSEHSEHGDHHATQSVSLSVTDKGFTPAQVKVKQGATVDLVITRKTDKTCATAINIPEYGIKRELPLNEAVTISLTPKKTGEIKYSCGMGMLGGVLTVN